MTVTVKRVFVTGATGQTGMHVCKYLNKHADKIEIHAGVHEGENKEDRLSGLKLHQHPVDADDIGSVVEAMRGCDAVFIVPSASADKVHHGMCYIRAAKRANVKFVLLLSMIGAEARHYLFAEQFRDLEEGLTSHGFDQKSWCILRSHFYTQNLLLYREQIVNDGVLPLPIGKEARFAPVDVEDVAKVAKDIFLDEDRHRGKVYTITGPRALSGPEMATACSHALGKSVRWEDISREEAKKILQAAKIPATEIQGLLEFYEIVSKGELQQVTQDFETITGDVPTDLTDFFTKHKDQLLSKGGLAGAAETVKEKIKETVGGKH